MKRRSIKKVASVLLVIFMFLPYIYGCSPAGKKTEQGNPKAADGATEIGYPIVTSPLTLKYWIPMNANATQYIRDFGENEAYQELEKRTGIHMDFIHPAQGQEKEQFNLVIASGDLPDIIGGAGRYQGGEFKGLSDGVFADLTPLLPKYAPDYYKRITDDPELKREVSNDDGKIVGFYRIITEKSAPARRIMVREDWIKELGLNIPKTIDDYEKYFKTVKEKKGVTPYLLNHDGVEEQFVGAFGIWAGHTAAPGGAGTPAFFMRDGKTVSFGKIQPEFKEYLTLMNKWYKEGYIVKDFPGMKTTQAQTTFDSGKAAMFVAPVVATFNRAQQLKIGVTSAPYPRMKAGDKLHWDDSDLWPKGGEAYVISNSSKYKTEAVRWFNYAYTNEGSMIYNYGVEGKSYVIENGVPKFTDYILRNPKFGTEPANYILKIHLGPTLGLADTKVNPNLALSPESTAIRKLWSDDKDVDGLFKLPLIQLNEIETDKRSKILTEVNTYADETILKFIIGAEPLSRFDEYVSNIKKLGIDEAVKITQDALTRYNNKK